MTDEGTEDGGDDAATMEPFTKYAQEEYKDDPFMKVIDNGPANGVSIRNIGMFNAVELSFIQGLRERVNQIAETIQENLDRDGGRPIEMPVGEVGIGLFELHVMAQSFFESCSTSLGIWALQMENDLCDQILGYIQENGEIDVLDDVNSYDDQVIAVNKYLLEESGMFMYQEMWSDLGILDPDLNDMLHNVRDRRNDYVHSPLSLTHIEDAAQVISIISECVTVVNSVQEWMESELPVDERFYSMFVDKD